MSLYFKKDYQKINELLKETMKTQGKKYTLIIQDENLRRFGGENVDKYKFVDSFDELKKEFVDAIFAIMYKFQLEYIDNEFVRQEGHYIYLEEYSEHSHSYELFKYENTWKSEYYKISIIELNIEEIKRVIR